MSKQKGGAAPKKERFQEDASPDISLIKAKDNDGQTMEDQVSGDEMLIDDEDLLAEEFEEEDDDPEDGFPNKGSVCTMSKEDFKEPELKLQDIKSQMLIAIYNNDMEGLKRAMENSKKTLEAKHFKFEILISFWMTIHLLRLDMARLLHQQDPIIEKILQTIRRQGHEDLIDEKLRKEDEEAEQKRLEEEAKNQKKSGFFGKIFKKKVQSELERESTGTSNKKRRSLQGDDDYGDEEGASRRKVYEDYEEKFGITTEKDIEDLKFLLTAESGSTFNTNVMRIALNMQEQRVASVIVGLYRSKVDEQMVIRAVKTGQMLFLFYMFVYNKNYEELMSEAKYERLVRELAKYGEEPAENGRFKVFKLEYIMKKILDYSDHKGEARLREIVNWRLKSTENVIKAILRNSKDDFAIETINHYIDLADQELLAFAIQNNNEVFIRHCVKSGIYGVNALNESSLIDKLLQIFKRGARTELVLNVLMYADFQRWNYKQLKEFIAELKSIANESHEKNRVMLCYNPILTVCLSCEFVKFISKIAKHFRHDCQVISHQLVGLGNKIIHNLDDDKISKIMLDRDFKDRTLLKIITDNGFEQLFQTYRITVLLEEIWQGKQTFDCDGSLIDISMLTYLLWTPVKSIKGRAVKIKDLIDNQFASAIDTNKFWFQYQYRHTSISYIYMKEFISSIAMVVLFQFINFQYLDLFKAKRYEGYPPLVQRAYAQASIKEYNQTNFLGTIFSASLFFHLLQKIIFNLASPLKLYFDKWTMIDIISALLNIACFNVIGSVTVDQVLIESKKQILDYYVICVTLVSWMRFFSFFFVIRIISKLLHTLIRMLRDTLAFIFIMVCYFMCASTIFTTLFQTPEPVDYGEVSQTLLTLFDAMLGQYQYTEAENYFISHSVLMMVHVFVSYIFLMNYLVAILSTVYTLMMDVGEFQFKSNKYQFIEKYSIPMMDEWGYRELVIHPPPMNFICMLLIPFSVHKGCMKKVSGCFSKLFFWIENIPFIAFFLIYEFMLAPIIIFKQFYNITKLATWKNFILLWFFWLICGPAIVIFYGVFGDLLRFMRVLFTYNVRNEENLKKEEEEFSKDKIVIYNEVMDVMRCVMYLYKKENEFLKQKGRNSNATGNYNLDVADILDNAAMDDQEAEADSGYTISKQLIVQAWARFRPQSEQVSPDPAAPGGVAVQPKKKSGKKDLSLLFGPMFLTKLIKGIKYKFYSGRRNQKMIEELKKQNRERQQHKDNDQVMFFNLEKAENETEDDPLIQGKVPKDEIKLVEEFLDKFVFAQIGSSNENGVDIKLALKALPTKVDLFNLYRVELLDFNNIQRSLIAFQNEQQDELFNHFDNRNKQRLRKLNMKASKTNEQSSQIRELSNQLLQLINKKMSSGAALFRGNGSSQTNLQSPNKKPVNQQAPVQQQPVQQQQQFFQQPVTQQAQLQNPSQMQQPGQTPQKQPEIQQQTNKPNGELLAKTIADDVPLFGSAPDDTGITPKKEPQQPLPQQQPMMMGGMPQLMPNAMQGMPPNFVPGMQTPQMINGQQPQLQYNYSQPLIGGIPSNVSPLQFQQQRNYPSNLSINTLTPQMQQQQQMLNPKNSMPNFKTPQMAVAPQTQQLLQSVPAFQNQVPSQNPLVNNFQTASQYGGGPMSPSAMSGNPQFNPQQQMAPPFDNNMNYPQYPGGYDNPMDEQNTDDEDEENMTVEQMLAMNEKMRKKGWYENNSNFSQPVNQTKKSVQLVGNGFMIVHDNNPSNQFYDPSQYSFMNNGQGGGY